MLTIKNIDKVINMTCYGREIYHVREHTNSVGQGEYVFEFDLIDGSGVGGWGTPKEVHLVRNEYNGTYGLFCMGLQVATERRIEMSKIKDFPDLLVEISLVLKKAKDWWEHSKTN
jgi:hypothetical protein